MIIYMTGHTQKRLCSVEGCGSKHYGHGLCSMHYQRKTVHGDVAHERPKWHGGRRKGHALYGKWSVLPRRASGCDPAWRDFDRFLADVGERPANCALVASDPREPIGPLNFQWRPIGKGHPKPNRKSMTCSVDGCSKPDRSIGLCALHYDRWIKRGTFDAPVVRIRDPEKRRASVERVRLKQYGLTPEAYSRLASAQDHVCAMCGHANRNGRRLSIDHDHDTGEVRALLCSQCNTGIGMFFEDEGRLMKAIAYLRKYKRKRAA